MAYETPPFCHMNVLLGVGVVFNLLNRNSQELTMNQSKTTLFRSRNLNRGVSKPGGFTLFSGKVQIVSRTLSGLFLVGAEGQVQIGKPPRLKPPRLAALDLVAHPCGDPNRATQCRA